MMTQFLNINSIHDLIKIANDEYEFSVHEDFEEDFYNEFVSNFKILYETADHQDASYEPYDRQTGTGGYPIDYGAWMYGQSHVSKEALTEFLIGENKDLITALSDFLKSGECYELLEAVGAIDIIHDHLSDELSAAFNYSEDVYLPDFFKKIDISLKENHNFNSELRKYDKTYGISFDDENVYFEIRFETVD